MLTAGVMVVVAVSSELCSANLSVAFYTASYGCKPPLNHTYHNPQVCLQTSNSIFFVFPKYANQLFKISNCRHVLFYTLIDQITYKENIYC